jgi:hypothetical protein
MPVETYSMFINGVHNNQYIAFRLPSDLRKDKDYTLSGKTLYLYSSGGEPSTVYGLIEGGNIERGFSIHRNNYITLDGVKGRGKFIENAVFSTIKWRDENQYNGI